MICLHGDEDKFSVFTDYVGSRQGHKRAQGSSGADHGRWWLQSGEEFRRGREAGQTRLTTWTGVVGTAVRRM
jgi:hypothetical protein